MEEDHLVRNLLYVLIGQFVLLPCDVWDTIEEHITWKRRSKHSSSGKMLRLMKEYGCLLKLSQDCSCYIAIELLKDIRLNARLAFKRTLHSHVLAR